MCVWRWIDGGVEQRKVITVLSPLPSSQPFQTDTKKELDLYSTPSNTLAEPFLSLPPPLKCCCVAIVSTWLFAQNFIHSSSSLSANSQPSWLPAQQFGCYFCKAKSCIKIWTCCRFTFVCVLYYSSMAVNWISLDCRQNKTYEDVILDFVFHHFPTIYRPKWIINEKATD